MFIQQETDWGQLRKWQIKKIYHQDNVGRQDGRREDLQYVKFGALSYITEAPQPHSMR